MDTTLILEHWPFVVVALFLGIVGEVIKRSIIPPSSDKPSQGWRAFYHATLPLHPAFAGALMGTISSMPCPDTYCTTPASRVLYYMAAGMLSSYVYAAVKHIARARLGSDTPP